MNSHLNMSIEGQSLNERLELGQDTDARIEEANKQLKEMADNLVKDYKNYSFSNSHWEYMIWQYEQSNRSEEWRTKLLMEVVKWALWLLKGGDSMDITSLALTAINAVIDKTGLDEQAYKAAADKVKEEIPGEEFEPLIGKILEGMGQELQKPSVTE